MLLTIFAWSLLAALLVMLLAPESQLGKAARHTLVDAPARSLAELTWAKAGRIVLLGPVFVLLLLAGPEMVALLIMMGGDLAAVEVLLVVWGAAISGGFAGLWNRVTALGRRVVMLSRLPRFSARQTPRRRKKYRPKRPDRDDEPGWAFA